MMCNELYQTTGIRSSRKAFSVSGLIMNVIESYVSSLRNFETKSRTMQYVGLCLTMFHLQMGVARRKKSPQLVMHQWITMSQHTAQFSPFWTYDLSEAKFWDLHGQLACLIIIYMLWGAACNNLHYVHASIR
jgi:hypothetical protein